MRDLYSRLGIKAKAPEEDIRLAVSSCRNSTLKEDASTVLLVPSRRRNYDRVYDTLRDIGALRANLGLNHSDHWQSPESDDFTTEPGHSFSLYDELVDKVSRINGKAKTEGIINSAQDLLYGTFRLVAVLGGIIFVGWIIISTSEETSTTASTSSKPSSTFSSPNSPPQQKVFSEPALPLPASGSTRRHTGVEGTAPLEIKTSSGANYLVKLEDVSTGNDILDVFIRGGSSVSIEVPLGTFRLKYATGQTWHGYGHYFGPSTSYNKADSTFHFYSDGYNVNGYTVTLYQVQNGNLGTSRLSPSQF